MRFFLSLSATVVLAAAGCTQSAPPDARIEAAEAKMTEILDAAQSATDAERLTEIAWYDAENLHKYINGMAPRFVDAGFVLLAHTEWRDKESKGPGYVELDFYDMGSPDGASLVFDEPTEAEALPLPGGVKAYAGDAMIEFRTDRYYVKLTARRDPAGQQTFLRDLAAAVAEAAAAPANPLDTRHQALETGRRLVEEGRYDEALSAYGRWGSQMEEVLRMEIFESKRQGEVGKVLDRYEAYFHYYPFGYLSWHNDWRTWSVMACDYAKLLGKTVGVQKDEAAAQTIAAAPVYRRLMTSPHEYKEAELEPLVKEIVGKYPKSLFCPAAVLTLANVRSQTHGNGAEAAPLCEEYLERMKKGGAPTRSLVLVELCLADAYTNYGNNLEQFRKGIAIYQSIAQQTDIAYENRACLLNAANAALRIDKGDALEESRNYFREFLAAYPHVFEADEARQGIVRTYLATGQTDEALQAARDLEKEAHPGADLSPALFDISRGYFQAENYEKSLALLKEIAGRYPKSATASMAYVGMGEVYEKLGQEKKAVEAYTTAATLKAVETRTSIMDASNTQNRAHEWLGAYYVRKQNWAEALKWWQSWKPSSWCGTCSASMESRRTYHIALCLKNLGYIDEALKTLEPVVFGEDWGGCDPKVASLFVDLYRSRGQLGALESRLQKAVQHSKYAGGAKIAMEYVAMIRMAERGDPEGLWKHLTGRPFVGSSAKPPWDASRAADLLVSIPDQAKPLALKKMAGEGTDPLWAAVLLARMKAPETLACVKEKIEAETNCWILQDYFYALALLGTEEAYATLRHYAEHGVDNRKVMAQKMLERYPAPGDAERPQQD